MMRRTIHRRIFLLLLTALSANAVSAQGSDIITKRVQFKKGTISGRATHDYVLGAKAGQTLSVRMSSNNTFLYFNVLNGASQEALFVGEREAAPNKWMGTLPSDGDYMIRVYLVRAEARRGGEGTIYLHGGD
jgi:hypothetical protein